MKTDLMKYFTLLLAVVLISCGKSETIEESNEPGSSDKQKNLTLNKIDSVSKPKNVVFILSDDHRYDFMGFTGKVPFLETPNMDRMGTKGVHFKNAFVTTSLCSPSRASILTGQFSHHHGVVDNQSAVADSVTFFPQYLQEAGYKTGYVGKWHMGEHHAGARPGFDYWVSFRGQGVYYNPTLNVNGTEKVYSDSSYITDLITEYSLDFLKEQNNQQPFFLYVSHKGVHSEFQPAERHADEYAGKDPQYPPTMNPKVTGSSDIYYNYEDVPKWVKEQRYSWHGVDYMYHGQIKFDDFYRRYLETLLSVDESIGEILDYLEEEGLLENTIVFYMGDNGFSFGEHGLIDKRHAYEESIRVPLLLYGAQHMGEEGKDIEKMVQNIDIAPSILHMAGLDKPENMDGKSFVPLLHGQEIDWRERIYYEYFWERPFPQTPTTYAVRTDKYKYIRYHGIWDINELYNLEEDPWEANNLIRNPEYKEIAKNLNQDLFEWLKETNGLHIPVRKDYGTKIDHKYKGTY
ncbi:sulfatase [Mangrovivirga sp. M17]|uniref:Sulfatase n=1 Tax=Mangrovivirga halotolerans TaxID=2993936 RepID=A0ABT3RKF8_9BACT|nr:sulfatase [Mangrovivirga halotolerans]MCX2742295.1 sulfatase [Mangrovivirga halotolerans]